MKTFCTVIAKDCKDKIVFQDSFECDKPFPVCDRFLDIHRSLRVLYGNKIDINYSIYSESISRV